MSASFEANTLPTKIGAWCVPGSVLGGGDVVVNERAPAVSWGCDGQSRIQYTDK